MAIEFNDNIHVKVNRPTDFRFGPFVDFAEANATIPIAQRYHGLIFGVYTDPLNIPTSDVEFYYYWNALSDTDINPLSGGLVGAGPGLSIDGLGNIQLGDSQTIFFVPKTGSYNNGLFQVDGSFRAEYSVDDDTYGDIRLNPSNNFRVSINNLNRYSQTRSIVGTDSSSSQISAGMNDSIHNASVTSSTFITSPTFGSSRQARVNMQAQADFNRVQSIDLVADFINSDGILVTDSVSYKGMKYAADYSLVGTLDPRWIPDWEAVQSAISVGGSKWTNVGDDIYRNSRVLVGATAFTDSTATFEVVGRVSQVGNTLSTFFGFEAGLSNSSIGANSAFGHQSLKSITTGHSNVAIGWIAGRDLQTGIDNIFVGRTAGVQLISGNYNTIHGAASMYTATSGSQNNTMGYAALFSHPNPSNQVAIGFQALLLDNQGTENTAIGSRVAENLRNATTNSQNVIIGYFAAQANLTMQNSIIIGRNARPAGNGQINQVVIGHDAVGLGSNTSAVGNASTVFGRWWGNLLLGTSTNSGDRLRVDGTVRFDTVTSATGDVVTIDANNVLRRQTVAQIGAAIGGGSVGAGIGLSKPASNILLGDNVTLFYTDTPTVKDFFLYQVGTNNLTSLYSGFGVTTPTLGEAGFAATNSAGSRGAEIKAEYDSASPNPFAKIQINSGTGLFNVFSSDQTTGYRVRDDIHQRGLVEHADYSTNKTDLSYTTIAWLKSRTNYNASVAQYFTHDASGVFAWVNI